MLLQIADTQAFVRPAESALVGSLTASSRSTGPGAFFDVLRREVNEIQVGVARYRLRSPLLITFYPRLEGPDGRLTVNPSPVQIVGSGVNFDEAWSDWSAQFHVRFQTLYGMRPWERQADERDEWEKIEQMVDVSAYRRETPYTIRQIGIFYPATTDTRPNPLGGRTPRIRLLIPDASRIRRTSRRTTVRGRGRERFTLRPPDTGSCGAAVTAFAKGLCR